jgi:DNA (cytosine-5)-methyltransferase 1
MRKSEIRYVSMFSGIEAATVAWHELGWKPVAFSDFDKFPKEVLAHHYPDVPDRGDVTKVDWSEYEGKADLVVGGSPCQSFSVAGKRLGMDDPRGNLALHFLGAVKAIKPAWFIFENVPGLLSSDGGRDFAAFLGEVAKCGYGFAYRVLDSQYFGVPQRRRRLFVVGHSSGDWRSPFSVLFERESLFGNPPPGEEAGQSLASFIGEGIEREDSKQSDGRGMIGFSHTQGLDAQPSEDVFPTLRAGGQGQAVATSNQEPLHGPVSNTLDASYGKGTGERAGIERQIIGEFWDGTDKTSTLTTRSIDQTMPDKGNFMGITQKVYENHGTDSRVSEVDVSPTITARAGTGGNNLPLVSETSAIPIHDKTTRTKAQNGLGIGKEGDPCPTLDTAGNHSVFQSEERKLFDNHFMTSRHDELEGVAPTLAANADRGNVPLVAEDESAVASGFGKKTEYKESDVAGTVRASGGAQGGGSETLVSKATQAHHVVRRLTPIECERLQGFPDNYTQIPWRGKPAEECPDGVRYKALGNSMAVPVMRWIAMGIEAVDGILDGLEDRQEPVRVEQKSIFDF